MLRTLAIALLAVVATIAGSAEAFAETKKSGTRSQTVHARKSPPHAVRPAAKSSVKSRSARRSPAVHKAHPVRGRVATRPVNKRATSKWGVGRYAPPARNILPPHPGRIDERAPRTLSFFHLHTHESITVTYKRNGAYVPSELARLNHFLRDDRTGTEVDMDPQLFDILWLVRHRLGSTSPYQVVSAYRSPSTNAWLVSYTSGVASNSRHMRGQAIDVMLPGRTPAQVRAAGLALGMGGVGYYPRTGFVHLDTGPVRRW